MMTETARRAQQGSATVRRSGGAGSKGGVRNRALVVVLLSAFVMVVSACNKGRGIIDDARKRHDAGDTPGAVAQLERVEKEAPGTPEVSQARQLAVDWLVEAAAKAPKDQYAARREPLRQALRWDPACARAAAQLCEIARDEGGFTALRKCLDGAKTTGADEALKALRDQLTQHDAEIKALRERKDLLLSSLSDDWTTLASRYPGSSEAARASKKLERRQSLCADEREFTLPIVMQASWMNGIVPGIHDQHSLSGKLNRIDIVQLESEVFAHQFETFIRRLRVHPIKPGEEPIRSWLMSRFGDIADFHAKYSDSLKKADTLKKLTLVVLVDDFVKEKSHEYVQDLKTAVEKPCAALASPTVDLGPDNLPTGFTIRKSCIERFKDSKPAAACYGEALAGRPSLEGAVMARVVMAIDGTVTLVEDAGSDLADEKVTSCILGSFRKRECDAPPGGEAAFKIACNLADKQAQCSLDPVAVKRPEGSQAVPTDPTDTAARPAALAAPRAGTTSCDDGCIKGTAPDGTPTWIGGSGGGGLPCCGELAEQAARGAAPCDSHCWYNRQCQIQRTGLTKLPCCKLIEDEFGCAK